MEVRYLPLQPHCFAFGGFEIQMLSTLQSVQEAQVSAQKLDVWSKDSDFDILHVWGLDQSQFNTIYWAKKSKKKVVVTALLPYMENFYQKLRNVVFSKIGNERYMRAIAQLADAIVVVNDLQKEVAINYFRSPAQHTFEIPNVVNEKYFHPEGGKFSKKYGLSDFILCAGNVCKRKNQLALVKACILNKNNLVLIGSPLAGEERLETEIDHLIKGNPNILWIKGFEPGSQDLANSFFDCKLFALPSYIEQQPISLLEAAAAKKPLLIADRAYAKQKYYHNHVSVNPNSIESIADGINRIFANPDKYIPVSSIIETCRAVNVGAEYKEVYNQMLANGN